MDKAVEAHRRRNSMVGALSLGQSRTQAHVQTHEQDPRLFQDQVGKEIYDTPTE